MFQIEIRRLNLAADVSQAWGRISPISIRTSRRDRVDVDALCCPLIA